MDMPWRYPLFLHINEVHSNTKIDESIDATFTIAQPNKPAIDCHVVGDLCAPLLLGFVPKLWVMVPDTVIELEKARIEFNGFVLPTYWHKITITDKLTGKKEFRRAHVDGPQWKTRGNPWWTTYRYMLEAFVDMIRAKEAGRESGYEGPWLSLDESEKLMSLIDAVRDRYGLPQRGL